MTKAQLRDKYKDQRLELSELEKETRSLNIANKVLSLDLWQSSFYHVFLSISKLNEVNTDPILSILSGKDKHIVVSKSNLKEKTLSHFLLTDNTKIIINSWSIPEPEDGIEINAAKIDVVFVPLLAFDERGHRVGYGQGFYDNFLKACKSEVIKVGISFFEPEPTIHDVHDNDIALNYCVTPTKIYSF